MRLDVMVRTALQSVRTVCPIKYPAPFAYYRPDQIKEVPEHLRAFVGLLYDVEDDRAFGVGGNRFREYCAQKRLAEAMVRDAFQCPVGTNIGFHADWKVIVVLPQDQIEYKE